MNIWRSGSGFCTGHLQVFSFRVLLFRSLCKEAVKCVGALLKCSVYVCCVLSWLFPDGDLEWSQFRRVKFIKWWLEQNGEPEFQMHNPLCFPVQQLHLFLISVHIFCVSIHHIIKFSVQAGGPYEVGAPSPFACVSRYKQMIQLRLHLFLRASLLIDDQECVEMWSYRRWKGHELGSQECGFEHHQVVVLLSFSWHCRDRTVVKLSETIEN